MTSLTEHLLVVTLTLAHFTPVCTTPTQLATMFFLIRKEATSELHLLLLLASLGSRGAGATCFHYPDWRGHFCSFGWADSAVATGTLVAGGCSTA